MRLRLTVIDSASKIEHDAVVECDPSDEVGLVVAEIARTFNTTGSAAVDGAALESDQPVRGSALRTGSVLAFGAPGPARRSGFAGAGDSTPRLRVLSGPSAGVELPLTPGSAARRPGPLQAHCLSSVT